jgi:hypothetical protein
MSMDGGSIDVASAQEKSFKLIEVVETLAMGSKMIMVMSNET